MHDRRGRAARGWRLGVDIGGTFTDIFAIQGESGEVFEAKVLTTPDDPLEGFMAAVGAFVEAKPHADVGEVLHATTLAINTVIERSGAQVGFLTTRGFRDVIEIGREDRFNVYDLQITLPEPLVPRERRLGVSERVSAAGDVVTRVDSDEVAASVRQLGPVDSIAIGFLNSFANPENERRASETVRSIMPNAHVSASFEVAPIVREFERFTAVVLNAYVGPVVGGYLARVEDAITELFAPETTVGIMKSDGGVFSPDEASRYPVRILESGPVAGIVAASTIAKASRVGTALAFDMGGTTAKACLVINGEPVVTSELDIARVDRSTPGSGFPVRLPSVDLTEIGAGGGSIAWIDTLGMLQVGPRSANAVPGPACYGLGGEHPTVTDADLILGYLRPAAFAGGTLVLDVSRAEDAISTLSDTSISEIEAAAWAIHDLVNEAMARAGRLHCVEHGIDPRDVTVIATGGAGPVHALALAEKLGSAEVIFPPSAGVASAFGLLVSPQSAERTVTDVKKVQDLTDEALIEHVQRLKTELTAMVPTGFESARVSAAVAMRLEGQGYEVPVRIPEKATVSQLIEAFRGEYEAKFAREPWGGRVEIVDWTLRLTNELPRIRESTHTDTSRQDATDETIGSEVGPGRAYFGPDQGWMEVPILSRKMFARLAQKSGPFLLIEPGSTIVVPPGWHARLQRDQTIRAALEVTPNA